MPEIKLDKAANDVLAILVSLGAPEKYTYSDNYIFQSAGLSNEDVVKVYDYLSAKQTRFLDSSHEDFVSNADHAHKASAKIKPELFDLLKDFLAHGGYEVFEDYRYFREFKKAKKITKGKEVPQKTPQQVQEEDDTEHRRLRARNKKVAVRALVLIVILAGAGWWLNNPTPAEGSETVITDTATTDTMQVQKAPPHHTNHSKHKKASHK